MFENEVLSKLPRHLMQLVIDQHYDRYSWQDHSIWRYVMRQNLAFLKDKAHHSYLDGLARTGISLEHIPDIHEMNRILSRIGWAAVTVDGFIPPAAFMEFQAYNVLVIAADIRPIDQVEYTPAPDIIHEAAGHAPIIADPDYAAYLKYFGEVGAKAFSSAADYELYEAIRHLSILKADPFTPADAIAKAEYELAQREKSLGIPSEMALIRNLHWWTVEYGLIGSINDPKIYGAGLLSSIGESAGALSDKVLKLPYTVDAVYYNFDITKPQPQLFVTPDFAHLTRVLDEFASRMALRKGGIEGILKAIESGSAATCVYSSGLQVSGTFTEYILHQNQPVYVRTTGPTMLCYNNKQLEGHGKAVHTHGFGSPIGRIRNTFKPPRYLEDADLAEIGVVAGNKVELEFESGITITGTYRGATRCEGKLVLMHFDHCLVRYQDEILFEPEWGTYNMAVGEQNVSVFSGPADPDAFGLEFPVPKEKTHRIEHTDDQRALFELYKQVRDLREHGGDASRLRNIWQQVRTRWTGEWLLPLEMAEYCSQTNTNPELLGDIRIYLEDLAQSDESLRNVIHRGLNLIQ
ncbi:MAG: aromatic amino acid hydroxylase [Bacteroidetes bacterium]|nr:aromatic amino acid hydroxylase [Bacteroidota bacterium]